eukprot:6212465-Pleurochrysis_carterae.AAC.2
MGPRSDLLGLCWPMHRATNASLPLPRNDERTAMSRRFKSRATTARFAAQSLRFLEAAASGAMNQIASAAAC